MHKQARQKAIAFKQFATSVQLRDTSNILTAIPMQVYMLDSSNPYTLLARVMPTFFHN